MPNINTQCPKCSDRHNTSEVQEHVTPSEPDREPWKYWWCLACGWKSEIFYYPAVQPELGLLEQQDI